jgi:hypothetical protein
VNRGRVDFIWQSQLEDKNVHDLEIRPELRKGGRDWGIPAQARPDSIHHLLELRWGGNIIGKEGETTIHIVNKLHLERRLLSECAAMM